MTSNLASLLENALRQKPICPYFFQCGGCDTQDIPYTQQVTAKETYLKQLFELLAVEDVWLPIIASTEEYPVYFRNKIRFAFLEQEGHISPSRHAKHDADADIAVNTCFLLSEEGMAIVNWVAAFAEEHHWQPYLPSQKIGWFKHLLLRESKTTGERLISLVTDQRELPDQAALLAEITERFPSIKSIFHTIFKGEVENIFTDTLLWGREYILDTIGDLQFTVAPHAFFQTNGLMLETLYQTIAMSITPNQPVIWDLYAGSASIGMYVHKKAQSIISIEENPQNIADAKRNLTLNRVENVKIVQGKVEDVLTSEFINSQAKPDVIIVDPPRSGLTSRLKTLLPHLPNQSLIYVSCNPTTCLRDCQELTQSGYRIQSLQGVDMFPHTLHCEMIAVLTK